MSAGAYRDQKTTDPLQLEYRWLWATQQECWEMNSKPLQERDNHVLRAEASLQSPNSGL